MVYFTEYLIAWGVYLLAAAGLMVVVAKLTHNLFNRAIAWIIRLCMLTLLIAPWVGNFENVTYLAPAILVMSMNLLGAILASGEADYTMVIEAATPIVVGMIASITVVIIGVITKKLKEPKKYKHDHKRPAPKKAEKLPLEMLD